MGGMEVTRMNSRTGEALTRIKKDEAYFDLRLSPRVFATEKRSARSSFGKARLRKIRIWMVGRTQKSAPLKYLNEWLGARSRLPPVTIEMRVEPEKNNDR